MSKISNSNRKYLLGPTYSDAARVLKYKEIWVKISKSKVTEELGTVGAKLRDLWPRGSKGINSC